MIVESDMMVCGVHIRVSRSPRVGGYSAELEFGEGDRAVVDAASLEELERLIHAVATPAAVARRSAAQRPTPLEAARAAVTWRRVGERC